MHELGILTQVVAALEEQLGGKRVSAVGMRVGALSGASVEALHGAWPMASGGTLADGARLEVEYAEAQALCPACGPVEIDEFFALTCPVCGTPTGQVIHGYETEVAWADVE